MDKLDKMKKIIGLDFVPNEISYKCIYNEDCGTYVRMRISYIVNNRDIPAFLLLPKGQSRFPAVLINHQHNREYHLGKSEVCGLKGNSLQAFGDYLVKKGFIVLAPDAICFEERRLNSDLNSINYNQDDWDYFLEFCNGVLSGETVAKKAIEDAIGGISVLSALPNVDKSKIGCLGHSYGGNTTYFVSAFDKRISYALSSGSVVSYKYRMENSTGIEKASIIPGFIRDFEIVDVIKAISPREFMIVSYDDDKWSKDALQIYTEAKIKYLEDNAKENLQIKQYSGEHALTKEQFDFIVEWIVKQKK